FFLDSFEHSPNVIDRHAEMIKAARIARTTLVESNTNVAVAGYDRARESARNPTRSQYSMSGCFRTLTLLGRTAQVWSKVEQTFIEFKATRRALTHDSDMFDS